MTFRNRIFEAIVGLAVLAAIPSAAVFASSEGERGWTSLPTDDMSDARRAEIRALIERNTERLAAENRLPAAAPGAGVLLGWPLRPNLGPSDFGYHGISAQVDHDANYPNLLRDYNCGTRSYDTASGYNHRGTDFFTWPFGWNRVDSDGVEVVAGADGVITGKDDGNFDRNCGTGGGNWNAVYIRHADGSVVWYGHMKNGSVTTKDVGDTVAAGEHLGVVASSGSSTGPHLHLEMYDSAGNLIDPWQGSCNLMNPDSWWGAQRPYYDSGVNKLMTGFAEMVWGSCPNPDQSNEAVVFHPGDMIWFSRFYRAQLSTQSSECTIYRPDSSVFTSWTSTSSQPYWAASMFWNSYWLGPGEPLGKWRFEVVFEGTTYNHDFWLVSPGPWLLRNARLTSIAPLSSPRAGIFVGAGATTLDLGGRDDVPRPGEGDDDDAYVAGFASGTDDPDATVLTDVTRPLVFYQLDGAATPLHLTKSPTGGMTISY